MISTIDKKQIIHIIAEIIIIFGISIYFSQKNKQLLNLINDLTQRLEDQEEQLNKHEQAINNLSNQINQLINKNPNNLPVHVGENLLQKNIPVQNIQHQFINPDKVINGQPNNLHQDSKKNKKNKKNEKNENENENKNLNEENKNISSPVLNLKPSLSIPMQIPMSMPTIVIEATTFQKKPNIINQESTKVEEVFEDEIEEESEDSVEKNEEELLDAELEEELKDLE